MGALVAFGLAMVVVVAVAWYVAAIEIDARRKFKALIEQRNTRASGSTETIQRYSVSAQTIEASGDLPWVRSGVSREPVIPRVVVAQGTPNIYVLTTEGHSELAQLLPSLQARESEDALIALKAISERLSAHFGEIGQSSGAGTHVTSAQDLANRFVRQRQELTATMADPVDRELWAIIDIDAP